MPTSSRYFTSNSLLHIIYNKGTSSLLLSRNKSLTQQAAYQTSAKSKIWDVCVKEHAAQIEGVALTFLKESKQRTFDCSQWSLNNFIVRLCLILVFSIHKVKIQFTFLPLRLFPFFRRGGLTSLIVCRHKESRHPKRNVCFNLYQL